MSDDESVAGARHNDGNRAFLQSFMARGTLTFKEAQPMLAAIYSIQKERVITPDKIVQADLEFFIEAAAEAISPFDYEIRSTRHQATKERVYALVNSVSDPLTQLATTRTTEEIYYIKRFLDTMFETNNTKRREVMAVPVMQALQTKLRKGTARQSTGEAGTQSQATDKGLTSDQTEKLLENLAKEKWITRLKTGYYILTPRALMELRGWLVEAYNEPDSDAGDWQRIKFCEACKEIVTIGQRCSNSDCNARLHNICEEAYWRARPGKTCAKCETAWDGKHLVGPKAASAVDDHLRDKRRSGVSKRRRNENDDEDGGEGSSGRRRTSRAEEEPEPEEEEEPEDEEAEQDEPSQNGSRIANGGRKRRNNRVVQEADESDSDE